MSTTAETYLLSRYLRIKEKGGARVRLRNPGGWGRAGRVRQAGEEIAGSGSVRGGNRGRKAKR